MTTRTFGKYLLDREIARGGMARVHLARLRGLGGFEKRLVLKEIDPKLASDPRFVALFVEEANTLVQMSHPHIVPVYELGVVEGTYFLAMEHVHGTTLEALVTERPLEAEEVAHVGGQIADALAYAHERFSLVHRDVTPRNVMIDAHGHARLLDFGIAARLDAGESGDAIFGTPGYLSPEQARGERLSPASDLFALGAVLHRAATGAHAFPATIDATRDLVEPAALPALEGVPDDLARIIRSALEPSPAKRPASGKVLAAQLRAFAARRPEGVADALGQRADRLATKAERAHEESPDEPIGTPPTSGRTQSLATSPALEEMLGTPPQKASQKSAQSGTEGVTQTGRKWAAAEPREEGDAPSTQRIERAREPIAAPREEAATKAATPASTPAATPTQVEERRAPQPLLIAGLTVLLALASVWALSYARFETPTGERAPNALDPTPLEIDPPDADLDAPVAAADAAIETSDAGTGEDAPIEPDALVVTSPPPSRDSGPRRTVDARVVRAAGDHEGTLTVQALPWADVYLDGARVGRTPLRDRRVPSGSHELTLRCPPLGREITRTVRIGDGATTRVSANLQTNPPTIVER